MAQRKQMDTEKFFIVFPAIDLRGGRVVRLRQGDPGRVTVYGDDPGEVAERWIAEGARWIHVVNLDGAFGEGDSANRAGLEAIWGVARAAGVGVQFGGGMRSLGDVEAVLDLGVRRVILGTVAVEQPELVGEAIRRWGAERVGVGIDAREGKVRVRGWVEGSEVDPVSLGGRLAGLGVRTVVFTNIARDGVGSGPDVEAARELASRTGLEVIASGGVASVGDVEAVRGAGLAGVIIGRALYEGQIDLKEVL
jgi:phosphoribosylformimino-5-aminoimidazole carboxamide ribotide isomerase